AAPHGVGEPGGEGEAAEERRRRPVELGEEGVGAAADVAEAAGTGGLEAGGPPPGGRGRPGKPPPGGGGRARGGPGGGAGGAGGDRVGAQPARGERVHRGTARSRRLGAPGRSAAPRSRGASILGVARSLIVAPLARDASGRRVLPAVARPGSALHLARLRLARSRALPPPGSLPWRLRLAPGAPRSSASLARSSSHRSP